MDGQPLYLWNLDTQSLRLVFILSPALTVQILKYSKLSRAYLYLHFTAVNIMSSSTGAT